MCYGQWPYGPVSIYLAQAGVLSKWLNGLSWFLALRLVMANRTPHYKGT